MQVEEIKALIESAIPESEAQVQLEGNHAHLVIVSSSFEGLNPVKKQQLVYGCLQESIASGAIHAVHMKTYTPSQWEAVQAP